MRQGNTIQAKGNTSLGHLADTTRSDRIEQLLIGLVRRAEIAADAVASAMTSASRQTAAADTSSIDGRESKTIRV